MLRAFFSAIALALCAAMSAPALAGPASARDLQAIVDGAVLRVAITRFDLPAFHVRAPDGALSGPEIEMARQVGRALGVKVDFVDSADSFDAVVDFVATGRADIGVSKLSQTYERLKRVRFSDPYVTLRHALLFNRAAIARAAAGRPPAAVLQKYNGRLGVIAGSAYVEFARRNFPDAALVEERGWEAAVDHLLAGGVDALYRDEFEIRRVLKNQPALNVKLGSAVITDQAALLSIAICDSCTKLQEFLNYHVGRSRGAFTLERLLASEGKENR